MKKTLFAFMALAATFAATSCQSDEELTQQPTGMPMVINAVAEGIGTVTRAEMKYKYDIVWSESDEIYVAGNSKNITFTLKTGQGTTNGTFECAESPFTSGDEVEAYYPTSLVDKGNLVWPAEQTTSTVVPMYSKNTLGGTGTENFSFASLGAMLQIVFNTEQAGVTLKSITLKDDTNPLSGTFTVDKEDGKALMATNADAPGITYDLGTGKALGKGANFFNIAVPAGTYSKLSFTFTATDNTVCTLKLKDGASITLDHNTVGRLTLTGKEFKSAKSATKGTAKAKIGESEVDVNWVQLWAGGPKFADRNVGASSVTETGTRKTFADATETGSDYVWGANWCTPSKEQMDELLKAASSSGSSKVTCNYCEYTTGDDKWGFKFTGLTDGYTDNSVFFPAQVGGSSYGIADYWSATADGSKAWDLSLYYLFGGWGSLWNSSIQDSDCLVRPVLKN